MLHAHTRERELVDKLAHLGLSISYDRVFQISTQMGNHTDSRMLLHIAHAARNGPHKIMIQTVDTDVVVIAVAVAQTLQPDDELWLAFGTGKSFRYLAAHEIAAGLGPEKACALPAFHALTGYDTVSSFVGHGKKTAWAVWAVFPELTHALLKLSSAPTEIPQEVMATIERFVILLYDRTSTCTEINKARRKLFARACKESSTSRRPRVGSRAGVNT